MVPAGHLQWRLCRWLRDQMHREGGAAMLDQSATFCDCERDNLPGGRLKCLPGEILVHGVPPLEAEEY